MSIADMGWGTLFTILSAKAKTSATKKVIKVDSKNTSQICSNCGEVVRKSLAVRIHKCTCSLEIDRDVNASINILDRGLELMTRQSKGLVQAIRDRVGSESG